MQKNLTLVLLAIISACTHAHPAPEVPHASLPLDATAAVDHEDGVHSFTSSPRTFETNSYWIEGPTGVVVIDTQFTLLEAQHVIDAIAATTAKPIVLAIVLHPNPDKFNGTSVFQEHGVRVVTSEQVRSQIPRVFEQRTRAFASRFPNEWPRSTPTPEAFGDQTTTIEAGGVSISLQITGRACSHAHVVATYAPASHTDHVHAFTGDMVANGTHAWLELGMLDEWQATLREVAGMHATRAHPGRGTSGGPELIEQQSAYFDHLRAVVEELRAPIPRNSMAPPSRLGSGLLGAPLEDAVFRRMTEDYPTLRYPLFLRFGLPTTIAGLMPEQLT